MHFHASPRRWRTVAVVAGVVAIPFAVLTTTSTGGAFAAALTAGPRSGLAYAVAAALNLLCVRVALLLRSTAQQAARTEATDDVCVRLFYTRPPTVQASP